MPASVEIKGLDQLAKKINSVTSLRAFAGGLHKGAQLIEGKISKYPPSSEANTPNGHWYERGYGPRWKGGTGGKRTSEDLEHSWGVQQLRGRALAWVVGTIVSYARFVQSGEDQTWFHKKRKWSTIEAVAEKYSKAVLELVKKNVDQALEK